MEKEPGYETVRRQLLELIRSGEFMKIVEEEEARARGLPPGKKD